MDSRGIGHEKQLLSDVFAGPVRNAVKQRVQDRIPGLVIWLSLPMQMRDYVGRRVEVIQNGVVKGERLKLDSGCLCAQRIEQTLLNLADSTSAMALL